MRRSVPRTTSMAPPPSNLVSTPMHFPMRGIRLVQLVAFRSKILLLRLVQVADAVPLERLKSYLGARLEGALVEVSPRVRAAVM